MQINSEYLGRMLANMDEDAQGKGERFLADVREVLETPEGRRVVRAILDRCGMYHEAEKINAEVYVQLGERNIGIFIMQLIHLADGSRKLWGQVQNTFMEDGHER